MIEVSQESQWSRPAVLFAGCAIVALILRLLVLSQVSGDPGFHHLSGDGAAYWRWSDSIVSGHWIGGDVFYQTPLYPYFLAILRKLARLDENGIRVLQAILGSLGCGMIALATRKFAGGAAGWIAGAMLALYPPAISYDLQIDKPLLDVLLASALVWAIALVDERMNWRRLLVAGILCGLLSLNRENALVLIAVLAIWVWWRSAFRTQQVKRVAILIAGAAAIVLPVALRNSIIGHDLILTTAQFGPNFYIGNNASADGAYHPLRRGRGDAMYERADATEIAEHELGRSLSPGAVSRYWSRRTFHDIHEAPGRWVKLLGRKFAMVFANSELADSDAHDRFVAWSSMLSVLDEAEGFGLLFVLAAVGVAISPHRRKFLVLVVMILCLAATMALFFIFGRYRMAIIPMLIPLSASACVALKRWTDARRAAVSVAALAASVGWILLADRAVPTPMHGLNAYNRAKYLSERGRFSDAESLYRQAIDQNPHLSAAWNNLGLMLADQNRLTEAIPLLRQAIALEPADPAAHINLGMALARQHQFDEAIEQFRTAISLKSDSTAAKYNLGAALMVQGNRRAAEETLAPIASKTSLDPFARRAALMLEKLHATRRKAR